jgi:hypothetical protein
MQAITSAFFWDESTSNKNKDLACRSVRPSRGPETQTYGNPGRVTRKLYIPHGNDGEDAAEDVPVSRRARTTPDRLSFAHSMHLGVDPSPGGYFILQDIDGTGLMFFVVYPS